jgi:hypothetical protein
MKTQTQNNFARTEEIGREKAELIANSFTAISKIENITDPYACYDQIWTLKDGRKFLVEVKVRDCKKNRYNTTILEEHKYRRIKEKSEKRNCGALYLNIYSDGWKLFDITDLSGVGITEKWCPRTTADGRKDMIPKKIIELNQNHIRKESN